MFGTTKHNDSHRCSHEEIHDSTGWHGDCGLAGCSGRFCTRRRWRRTWRRRWRRRWRWHVAAVGIPAAARVPAAAQPRTAARRRAGGGYSGGARAGGGYSGGASFGRSPGQSSRAAPSQGMNRPSQLPSANRPSQRPSTGYGQGNRRQSSRSQLPATRPGTGGTSRRRTRPGIGRASTRPA